VDICTGQRRGIYRAKTHPLATTTGGPMTPLDIALSLTLQQRDALCGFYSWNSRIEQEEGQAEQMVPDWLSCPKRQGQPPLRSN
jgi:hypothetical protein